MELVFVLHRHPAKSRWAWLCVLMLVVWVAGCRVDNASCTSNEMCADGEVCSSTGVCELHEVRVQERQQLFQRFGADVGAYGQWLRYGTAGARTERAMMTHNHPSASFFGDASPNQESNATFDSAEGPNVLCSIEDVRTDDLLFTYTRAYPAGYWGDEPIADRHGGRCGDDLETLAWRLLNCERITRELPPVNCDLRLVWISRQHADDMASRDFFDHINPEGQNSFHRLSGRGIHYGLAGENLARQRSIFDAHTAWMDSPQHRRNILTEQYHYAGIGVVPYGRQLMLTEAFLGGVTDGDADESVGAESSKNRRDNEREAVHD